MYNFLLERSELSQIISRDQFARLFPAGTSPRLINSLYKHLTKRNSDRIQAAEDAINQREHKLNEQKGTKLNTLKKMHDNSSISVVNGKLDQISTLLARELERLEEDYDTELQKLKDLNDNLSAITYPRAKDEPLNSESIETLIESLQSFSETLKPK